MGALEGNYKIEKDPLTGKFKPVRRDGLNPMAVTDRTSVSTFFGGNEEFKKLIDVAKEKKIKVLLDCVARVSSARPNRRYKDLLLHSITDDGKEIPAFGGEGRAINYEDTIYLNYRYIIKSCFTYVCACMLFIIFRHLSYFLERRKLGTF